MYFVKKKCQYKLYVHGISNEGAENEQEVGIDKYNFIYYNILTMFFCFSHTTPIEILSLSINAEKSITLFFPLRSYLDSKTKFYYLQFKKK